MTLRSGDFLHSEASIARQQERYELSFTGSLVMATPSIITFLSGSFEAKSNNPRVQAEVAATIYDHGGGHAGIYFLYAKRPYTAPLNYDYEFVQNPAAIYKMIGQIGAREGVAARSFTLPSVKTGDIVDWELAGNILGGAAKLDLSETPFAVSAQRLATASLIEPSAFDTIVAARGASKAHITLYNAYIGGVCWDLLGTVALPSSTGKIAVAPTGQNVVATSTSDNSIMVIVTDFLTGKAAGDAGFRYVLPDAAAGPGHVGVHPNNPDVAYVSASNGNLYSVTISTGVWGATVNLGASTNPGQISFSSDGVKALVACPGTNEVVQVNLVTSTITQRYAVSATVGGVAFAPGADMLGNAVGHKAYTVSGHGDQCFTREIDTTALTITAEIQSSRSGAGFVPGECKMMSDGRSIWVAGDGTSPSRQHLQINIPNRLEYSKSSHTPAVPLGGIALSNQGSIFEPTTNGLIVLCGVQIRCGPGLYAAGDANSFGEFAQVSVDGAIAA